MATIDNRFIRRLFLLLFCDATAMVADTRPVLLNLSLPYVNDFVWDATRSRFYVSSGTNVLMVNPETANVEDTIPIGDIADRIAVSGDGQYLYGRVTRPH